MQVEQGVLHVKVAMQLQLEPLVDLLDLVLEVVVVAQLEPQLLEVVDEVVHPSLP